MTILVLLADNSDAAAAFNSTFYVASVTIIPVLYLAVAVQGPLYGNLMQASFRAFLNYVSGISLRKNKLLYDREETLLRIGIGIFTGWVATAILFFGIVCEILGLLSLYRQRAVGGSWLVLAAVIFMTIVVVGGPISAMAKPAFDVVPLLGIVKDEPESVMVVAVLISNEHVLLVRSMTAGPNPEWSFPRGNPERRETISVAVIRNTLETTNFVVSVVRPLGRRLDPESGREEFYVACIPRYEDDIFDGGKIVRTYPSGDTAEIMWCNLAQLDSRIRGIYGPVRRYLSATLQRGNTDVAPRAEKVESGHVALKAEEPEEMRWLKGTFISYRREDATPYAHFLGTLLRERLRDTQVFMDVDVTGVSDAIRACGVVVALIGSRWATITDDKGGRVIDDPGDPTRLELQTAFECHVRVIPVLVDDAKPLRQQPLPSEFEWLAEQETFSWHQNRYQEGARELHGRILDALLSASAREARSKNPLGSFARDDLFGEPSHGGDLFGRVFGESFMRDDEGSS
jgi:ADP-ribose pyrophosphatase YjhB (NUDIX family)